MMADPISKSPLILDLPPTVEAHSETKSALQRDSAALDEATVVADRTVVADSTVISAASTVRDSSTLDEATVVADRTVSSAAPTISMRRATVKGLTLDAATIDAAKEYQRSESEATTVTRSPTLLDAKTPSPQVNKSPLMRRARSPMSPTLDSGKSSPRHHGKLGQTVSHILGHEDQLSPSKRERFARTISNMFSLERSESHTSSVSPRSSKRDEDGNSRAPSDDFGLSRQGTNMSSTDESNPVGESSGGSEINSATLSPRSRSRFGRTISTVLNRDKSETGEASESSISPRASKAKEALQRTLNHATHLSFASQIGAVSPRLEPSATNKDVESVDFPSLESVEAQPATKKWFVWETRRWEEGEAVVKISPLRFCAGPRYHFHFMTLQLPDGTERQCVARRPKTGPADEEPVMAEVLTVATAQALACDFNARKPVVKVNFLDSWLIQLQDGSCWGVEPYLAGRHCRYYKHFGVPEVGDARNPQAFSHFTFQFTKMKLIVLGIRGIGDYFRDPIIHTHDGMGFGSRNAGKAAIDEFFDKHWCNAVCAEVELELHMAKKMERKLGDMYIGDGTTKSITNPCEKKPINFEGYLNDWKPVHGVGTAEDLSLLGLDRRSFNRLVDIFVSMDRDASGDLDSNELQHVFERAATMQSHDAKSESYLKFAHSIQTVLVAQSRVSFRNFILCWTNNL